MDLQVTDVSAIKARLKVAVAEKNVEFEVNFGALSNEGFRRVINAFSVNKAFSPIRQDPSLDITKDSARGGARVTITGEAHINDLCSHGVFDRVPEDNMAIVDKRDVKPGHHRLVEFGITTNLRKEEPISDIKPVLISMSSVAKHMRYKQRVSFVSSQFAFRVDCTVVNQGRSDDFSLAFGSDARYEVELELVDRKVPVEDAYKQLQRLMVFVMKNVENSPYILPRSTKDRVLLGYTSLVSEFLPRNMQGLDASSARTNANRVFIGPKPSALMLENVLDPKDGRVSILEGYTVTDKADGERMMLYVASDGNAYVLNNLLDVKFTGIIVSKDLAGTLLDGEYIDEWRVAPSELKEHNTAWFMCFDVYYLSGKVVAGLPLSGHNPPTRLTTMETLADKLTPASKEAYIKFRVKTFETVEARDMFDAIKRTLTADKQYNTDGVIFTPALTAVGANYPNEPPKMTGTWTRTMKWKPPEKSTIDFLVRFGNVVSTGDNLESRLVKLFVGHMENDVLKSDGNMQLVNILTYGARRASKSLQQPVAAAYVERQFSETLLPLRDGKAYCDDTDEVILNGTIIEFGFADGQWRPQRVRHDKTNMYRRTGSIAAANNYVVAEKTWKSIQQPVSKEVICGETPASDIVTSDMMGTYYLRDTDRDRLEIKPMLDFHNHWVKKVSVFDKLRSVGASSLLDIGCGRGGDLYRWIGAQLKTVVGLDVSENDLLDPNDGAYARLMNMRASKRTVGNEKIVFLQWDCTKPIAKEFDVPKRNKDLQELGDVAFAFIDKTKIPRDMAPYYGIGNTSFDAVSCQFAVHYFFKSKDTLQSFTQSVGKRLKKGGIFLCTCMDADEVDKMFTKAQSNTVKSTKSNKVIWMLTKKYESFDFDSPQNNYGKEIDVFIESINNTVTEYLVDYQLLCKHFKEVGIVPMTENVIKKMGVRGANVSFRDLFMDMEGEHKDTTVLAIKNAVENMTSQEKRFSFLNRVYYFVKD